METLSNKKCLLFFVRHGERQDEIESKTKVHFDFKFDPPLSEHGKQQAFQSGLNIAKFIEDRGYSDVPIKFISSPFLRTLQTAA